jgi:hypothetical protein
MDWIGIGEKADGRVETREEKSVEGMGGKVDGRERESVRIPVNQTK